ncbi:DUF3012 domain-containing protein [Arsukibacterium sp.]|uniref:DUF3012 domain-containing protein n=1 Tax=Arsukibacterium sp. TaxID=1977258 RepID=UPI002FD9E144
MKKWMALIIVSTVLLSGCSPEVGSKKWCEAMQKKPKGDWTVNDTKDFARYCLLKGND